MPTLNLNHLIDLDALLSEGSVAGAARRLHLSAPAMSRRLARLREAFGDPLFILAGRRLVPTERALALNDRLRALLEDARELLTPPSVDLASVERTMVFRANDGFAGAWAARLAARVCAEAPGVRLCFLPKADKDMEALRNGTVDVDLGVLSRPAPEIVSQVVARMKFVGVVRAGHPLLAAGEAVNAVDAARLVEWPHISVSWRGRARGPLDEALEAHGLKRRVALVAPGFQAALTMARESDFVATVPEPFARWSNEPERLTIFPLPIATPEVPISMSWHPRVQADPLHRWLRERVREALGSPDAAATSPAA